MFTQDAIMDILFRAPVLLLSLTVHEFAHARTALAFGDDTALRRGRCSLNPLVHLDPMGTICMLLVGFGWAKPVPVNPMKLYPPRMGDMLVSLAGPMSNLALAVISAIGLRLLWQFGSDQWMLFPAAEVMLLWGVLANVLLCVFNLVPLFPLDGHHILRESLPERSKMGFMQWQMRYGRFALMGLIMGPMLLNTTGRDPIVPDPLAWLFRITAGWFIDKVVLAGLG